MGATASKNITATGLRSCTLWKADRSPACRAVMMALDAMNLNVTEVDLNMDKGEHRTTEMTVKNPRQTLPILQDKKLILCDSHAISMYLASRYCHTSSLLPTDPGGRAVVYQLMHYDSGILQPRYRAAAYPILYENCRFVMPEQVCDIECSYVEVENMLSGRQYLTGNSPTLADIAIASSISTLNVLVPVDKHRYPRLSTWLYKMAEEPYYITANHKGIRDFAKRIDCGSCFEDREFKCPRTSVRRRTLACQVSQDRTTII